MLRQVIHIFTTTVPPKRDEVTGGWRKLQNEELHGLYSSPSKEDEMGGACGAHGEGEGCIQHFVWEA
jgi:hypothetical protein